ncbi:hypothetical protein [Streptomyces sp. KL116D]|uniref:hypothetical protein n=1 Tax=Streptomyces sp. KL116D TaxID=3045152 RepID=UPI003557BC6A
MAALVFATAEITRAHPHQLDTAWFRGLWQDRAQVPEARLAAAIGWLSLTDEPAPDLLHTTVNTLATEERARAMDALPWMTAVGCGEPGLLRCVRRDAPPRRARTGRRPLTPIVVNIERSALAEVAACTYLRSMHPSCPSGHLRRSVTDRPGRAQPNQMASQAVASCGVEQQEEGRHGGHGETDSGQGGEAPDGAPFAGGAEGLPGAVGEEEAEQSSPRGGEARG